MTSYDLETAPQKIDPTYFVKPEKDDEWQEFLQDLESCIEVMQTKDLKNKRSLIPRWRSAGISEVQERHLEIALKGDLAEDGGLSSILLEVKSVCYCEHVRVKVYR